LYNKAIHKFTGEKIYQKSRGHVKIVGTTMMTYSKIHIWGSTNIRCHDTTFSHQSDPAPGTCALPTEFLVTI